MAKLTYRAERPASPAVGDCWSAPWLTDLPQGGRGRLPTHFLSDAFIAAWDAGARRLPLIVRLPGANGLEAGAFDFCVDGPFWRDGHRIAGSGWSVTLEGPLTDGETPNLTVHPSIDIGGGWHGWLAHGVLSGGGLP